MEINETIYNLFMAPFEMIRLKQLRKRLIRHATGKVLEIGAGTGVNFRYYNNKQISSLTVMDLSVSETVKRRAIHKIKRVRIIEGDVMHLPFKAESFDTVVFTLLFCSVEDPLVGLSQVKKVLKPGGQILFIEHVLPEHHLLSHTFHRLSPYWLKLSKSCHITRQTQDTIKEAGFEIVKIERHLKGTFICGIANKSPLE